MECQNLIHPSCFKKVMSTVAENEWEGLLFCGKQCLNNNKKVLEAASKRKSAMAYVTSNTGNQLNGGDHRLVDKRGELQLMAWRRQTKWHDKSGHCP